MTHWLAGATLAQSAISLSFGIRAGAIFVVVIGSIALGRWLQQVVRAFTVRGDASVGDKVNGEPSLLGRWLGRFAFLCVLLAGAAAVLAIVNYDVTAQPIDLGQTLREYESIAKRIVAILLLVPITLAAAGVLQRWTIRGIGARVDPSLKLLAARSIYILVLIIGCLVILSVWGISLVLPVAVLGVVTLALSLALQDVLRNIFAGVYLLVERPFVIGDEITVTTFTGRVEDIQLRVTRLLTPDGQRVLVPNAILFTSAVVNASPPMRRRTPLAIDLAGPVAERFKRKALVAVTLQDATTDMFPQLEQSITNVIEGLKGVERTPAPQVMLNHAGQGKLDLRVAFWVPAREETAQDAISEAINQISNTLRDADVSVVESTPVS